MTQQASLQLEKYLKDLTPEQTICVVRAFSYFKHLVNIAEDLYTQQLTRLNEDNLSPGMLAHSVNKITAHNLPFETIDAFFKDALVSPVLTAHPTEVQRKSILDIEHTLAFLLAERGNLLSKKELERNHLLIEGAICSLWQTRILRFSKLTVINEIENALSYYETTFLKAIPEILQDLERDLNTVYGTQTNASYTLPSFLNMGSWIGGDRDGNPFVNGTTLLQAIHLQTAAVFKHYVKEFDALRRELAVSSRLISIDKAVLALAERSRDQSPHRLDEPYRLAINGIFDKLLVTAQQLAPQVEFRDVPANVAPYADADTLLAELAILTNSLKANQGEKLVYARLGKLTKAIETFGFHLATIDIRQSSDVHEAVIKELFHKSGL